MKIVYWSVQFSSSWYVCAAPCPSEVSPALPLKRFQSLSDWQRPSLIPSKEDCLALLFPRFSSPGDQWCDVLGFVPTCSVLSSSTLQIFWDARHLWGLLCLPVYPLSHQQHIPGGPPTADLILVEAGVCWRLYRLSLSLLPIKGFDDNKNCLLIRFQLVLECFKDCILFIAWKEVYPGNLWGFFPSFFYHLMNTSALLFLTPLALCGLTLFQNAGTSSQLCIKKLSSGRTATAVDILSWWFPQHSGWCSFSLNNLQRLLPQRHLNLFGLTCLLLSTGTRQLPDSTDARASLPGTLYAKMSRSFLVSEPRSWFNEHSYKLC